MFGGIYFGQTYFAGVVLYLYTTIPAIAVTTYNAEPVTAVSYNTEPTVLTTWQDTP